LNSLGNIYLTLRNYDLALKYFQEALQLQQTISPSNPDKLAMLVNNIGLVFLEQKKYDEALAKFQEVFAIQKDSFPERKINNAGLYLNIGLSYTGQKQYTTALESLQKARLLFEQTQLKHTNLSNVYLQISKIHLQLNQSDSALVYCQKALIANIPYFNLMDTDEMPNISQSLDPNLLLEILQTKGIIFRKMYQKNPNNKYLLVQASQNYALADKLITDIEQKQLRQADKMEFAQKKKQIFTQTLDTYWEQIKKP
jgi:tetratricopeptide (TPR) repeat protein